MTARPARDPTQPGESAITVPQHVLDTLVATQGTYYEAISGVDRHKIAADLVDEAKAHLQAALLERHARLEGARMLEVGAGVAMNLVVWTRAYHADAHGIEPDSAGFEASFKLGRTLMEANGLDPERLVNAVGERLPFPDASFDIVYSANVLEHTERPIDVLDESLRVLRPGGTLQFVFPNYRSYYDGHYGIFHPPILWRGLFPWWVKWIMRRDPAYAHTLRTELNGRWSRRAVRELARRHRFEVLGFGENVFIERMVSLQFADWASLGRVKRVMELFGHRSVRALLARGIILFGGWTPVILTLRKLP